MARRPHLRKARSVTAVAARAHAISLPEVTSRQLATLAAHGSNCAPSSPPPHGVPWRMRMPRQAMHRDLRRAARARVTLVTWQGDSPMRRRVGRASRSQPVMTEAHRNHLAWCGCHVSGHQAPPPAARARAIPPSRRRGDKSSTRVSLRLQEVRRATARSWRGDRVYVAHAPPRGGACACHIIAVAGQRQREATRRSATGGDVHLCQQRRGLVGPQPRR